MIVVELLFWLSGFLVVFSYALFPLLIKRLAKNKSQNSVCYVQQDHDLPYVDIVFAAYNEELVIEKKIHSIFNTSYPLHKIKVYIGSDSSTDNTNTIVEQYAQKYSQIYFKNFDQRSGKINILNDLVQKGEAEVLVLTDANVFFHEHTIFELAKHFKNTEIAVVGGNIENHHHQQSGIAVQENAYLQRENQIKFFEGVVWGAMIGAFGGLYAIRRKEFIPVPTHYIVDDFFISMNPFRKGLKAINELQATYYEDITNKIEEEYRRKVRISIGNFQNLANFKDLLLFKQFGVSFCFISHKVLRWLSPVLMLIALIANIILHEECYFYKYSLLLQFMIMCMPVLDYVLKQANIHVKVLRFISHFYGMNIGLFIGMLKYLSGSYTSVWKPTERNINS